MKMGLAILLGLLSLLPVSAQAAEYVFNCRNEWTQDLTIRVHAESIDAARKLLRTDKALRDQYSLDQTRACVFRSEILDENGKSKPMPKKKSDEPITE